VLARELGKSIDVLDLTSYQKRGLRSIGLETVGKALQASEADFQEIDYIGPKRLEGYEYSHSFCLGISLWVAEKKQMPNKPMKLTVAICASRLSHGVRA